MADTKGGATGGKRFHAVFALATFILTRLPWYTNLTYLLRRLIYPCTKNKRSRSGRATFTYSRSAYE